MSTINMLWLIARFFLLLKIVKILPHFLEDWNRIQESGIVLRYNVNFIK
jgi:hypothetical protein